MKLTPEELDLVRDILARALFHASGDKANDIKALLSRFKDYEAAINAQINAAELAQLKAENTALWGKLEALQREYAELEQQAAQDADFCASYR